MMGVLAGNAFVREQHGGALREDLARAPRRGGMLGYRDG